MAFAITGPKYGHFLSPEDAIRTVADKTANGVFTELGRAVRYAHVRIYLKTFVIGTATVPTQFVVEAASVSDFTTDLVSCGMAMIDLTDEGAALIICYSPLKALKFWRIRPVFDGNATGVYDAELSAAG